MEQTSRKSLKGIFALNLRCRCLDFSARRGSYYFQFSECHFSIRSEFRVFMNHLQLQGRVALHFLCVRGNLTF